MERAMATSQLGRLGRVDKWTGCRMWNRARKLVNTELRHHEESLIGTATALQVLLLSRLLLLISGVLRPCWDSTLRS